MIYIASPYSHPDPRVRDDRAYLVGTFAAEAVKSNNVVYSPIASWHHLAKEHKLPSKFSFWQQLNFEFLKLAEELWVLRIPGWSDSVGVQAEIRAALIRKIPVRHFNGTTFKEIRDGYNP